MSYVSYKPFILFIKANHLRMMVVMGGEGREGAYNIS